MASLSFEGKLKAKLPQQGGQSARGPWVKQDFVLEYQDGSFPAEACFTAWGQDSVGELARMQVGDTVKLTFNIKAREYNGRWYNDLRVRQFSVVGASAPASAPAPSPSPAPAPAAAPLPPPPGIEYMPADVSDDDLPF